MKNYEFVKIEAALKRKRFRFRGYAESVAEKCRVYRKNVTKNYEISVALWGSLWYIIRVYNYGIIMPFSGQRPFS